MSISAKELARILNKSPATISMVLNNRKGISEETRKMVMDGAKKYGYDMSKKRDFFVEGGTLLFLIYRNKGDIVSETPFFSQVTEGIEFRCKQSEYQLTITYIDGTGNVERQLSEINFLSISGTILLGTEITPDVYKHFLKIPTPLVVLDSYFNEIESDAVLINNVQGAYLATRHLLEKGHRQIGYLRSNIRINNFKERADGYYQALRNWKLPTDHPYVCSVMPTMDGAYQDTCAFLLTNPKLPTAYFADNDIIAIGALRAFKESGIRIPEDVSIIGFDDMPSSEFIDPPLSSMHVQKQMLGILAVDRILAKIEGETDESVKIELAVSLKERKSVLDMN